MYKVSVIIPFYNQEKILLEQAIYSVLNQTLSDIEIICVDDGSEEKYVFDIERIDSRIKLIKKEHSGSGESRNIGIKSANGENIMFLDSDDFFPDSNVLEKLYTLKQSEKVKISGAKHLILNKNGCFEEPYFNYGNIDEFFCNKIVKYKDYQFPWWYWCFMYDTNLIKENNIYFPAYLRYQDPPFFVRIMNKAEKFYAADFISYIHRDSSNLFSLNSKTVFHHVRGIADVLKYSKENNLDKLFNLLYKTFLDFDVKLFDNIKDLDERQKNELINIITTI